MTNDIEIQTPKTVSDGSASFTIPIYQRLFEWDEAAIRQLISDLISACTNANAERYYIGMLTATHASNNNFVLVDGQQRFTVMTLLAITLMRKEDQNNVWINFLIHNGMPRLKFEAREEDQKFLEEIIKNEGFYKAIIGNGDPNNQEITINRKMAFGLKIIARMLDKECPPRFAEFLSEQLSFFITQLPENYTARDLNQYFERMNSTGKNLENYEILKVQMLKGLDPKYVRAWNKVSEMNHRLIPRGEKETDSFYLERYKAILESIRNEENIIDTLFSESSTCNEQVERETIAQIIIKSHDVPITLPTQKHKAQGENAILTFPRFLLQVLYYFMNGDTNKIGIVDFFDETKLLDTFHKNWDENKRADFVEMMVNLRLIFDYGVIRPTDSGNYRLLAEPGEGTAPLNHYQQMLYVNSSNVSIYKWLQPYFKAIWADSDPRKLLEELKRIDNENHENDTIGDFSYPDIDRYWFWRLDYYLWEKYAKGQNSDPISAYVFKRNRSIEHLHPQNQDKQYETWSEKEVDSFMNLAMISQGFNSTQSNDSVLVKMSRIAEQIKRNELESIKMYMMYQEDPVNHEWAVESARKHGREMMQILIDSFPEEKCAKIREKWNAVKRSMEKSEQNESESEATATESA